MYEINETKTILTEKNEANEVIATHDIWLVVQTKKQNESKLENMETILAETVQKVTDTEAEISDLQTAIATNEVVLNAATELGWEGTE